ncbi:MAG: hypothetical protein Kow0069_36280 [Promethearchaeota archaeon]
MALKLDKGKLKRALLKLAYFLEYVATMWSDDREARERSLNWYYDQLVGN